jgi:hypothetical protein
MIVILETLKVFQLIVSLINCTSHISDTYRKSTSANQGQTASTPSISWSTKAASFQRSSLGSALHPAL